MSASPQTMKFDLSAQGIQGKTANPMIPFDSRPSVSFSDVVLPPFGVLIAQVE
jgi:hypothetical protein